MSDLLPVGPADSNDARQTLTQRVLARVNDASLAADLRARGSRPKARRRRPASSKSAPDVTQSPEQLRTAQSLKRVFVALGDSYRDYRRRTGAPLSEDVRAAADRFRRERNVTALVSVAASLDELDLLPW